MRVGEKNQKLRYGGIHFALAVGNFRFPILLLIFYSEDALSTDGLATQSRQ
jgi:hypothetical protein